MWKSQSEGYGTERGRLGIYQVRLGCVRDLRWVDWEPLSEASLVPSGENSCLFLLRVHWAASLPSLQAWSWAAGGEFTGSHRKFLIRIPLNKSVKVVVACVVTKAAVGGRLHFPFLSICLFITRCSPPPSHPLLSLYHQESPPHTCA